jgi:hypothetical protein
MALVLKIKFGDPQGFKMEPNGTLQVQMGPFKGPFGSQSYRPSKGNIWTSGGPQTL